MFKENRNQIIEALNARSMKDAAAFFSLASTPPREGRNGKDNRRMDAAEVEKMVARLAAAWTSAHPANGKHPAPEKGVIMQILGPDGNTAMRQAYTIPSGAKLSLQVADEAAVN